jgi:hypothetical protein
VFKKRLNFLNSAPTNKEGALRLHKQFSGCSSTTNAHSETGQMAVCCQNLSLGALSSRSAPCLLVGALFKKVLSFFLTRRDSGKCDKRTARHPRKCVPGSIPTMEEKLGTVYLQ